MVIRDSSTKPGVAARLATRDGSKGERESWGSAAQDPSTVVTIASSLDMSDADFRHIAAIVESHLGIKMPQAKKPLVASRLSRRLRDLKLATYGDYCGYLNSIEGSASEMIHFTDLITTHKTSFFREAEQFEVLTAMVIPELLARGGSRQAISVWSAGCSTGQEVYTLGMVLEEYRAQHSGEPTGVTLLGTDVSELVLQKARNAIYEEDEALSIPPALRSKYLLRSKNSTRRQIRIAPALRKNTHFRVLNFNARHWELRTRFHAIFCRNVLIYFDAPSQERIIRQFSRCLEPGGYLFLGLSEGVGQLRLPLLTVARSVYRMDRSQGSLLAGAEGE